jgi:hypothetical protein
VEVAKQVKDVTIEAKVTPPEAGAKMKRLEITLKAGKGKLPPAGMIGWLTFIVDEKARSQMISLPVVEANGFPKAGGSGAKLHADSGGVTIYESGMEPQPLVGCFFFTH